MHSALYCFSRCHHIKHALGENRIPAGGNQQLGFGANHTDIHQSHQIHQLFSDKLNPVDTGHYNCLELQPFAAVNSEHRHQWLVWAKGDGVNPFF
jgi:hypothetical protein